MGRKLWLWSCVVSAVMANAGSAAADSVKPHLGGYHLTKTLEQLTQIAGGTAPLVSELLQLRHDTQTPFAAVRAEKLLLQLAGQPGVQEALSTDVKNAQFTGLARVVAIHLDDVGEPAVRQALASSVLDRAKTDSGFRTYARSLVASRDAAVSAAARTALGQ